MLNRIPTESVVGWYNRLMRREDWARVTLRAYAGRSARIEAGLASVFLRIEPDGMLAPAEGVPSVTITLDPASLARAWMDPAGIKSNMKMNGDVAFAQVLTDVLSRLRPDPAEDLAKLLGDAPAERIAGLFRDAFSHMRDTAESLTRQGADYLVAENPMLLGRQEWESFRSEVDSLQSRLAALEERIDALPSAAPTGSS